MSDKPSTSAAKGPPPSAQTLESKNFTIIEEIGTGAFGTVYKAKNVLTQELVALKKITVSHYSEEGMPLSTIREIAMLRKLENRPHANIVRLLDVVHGPKVSDKDIELNLVFEYIEQDLAMYLSRCPSPGLEKDRIRDLAHQLVTGVDFLHSNLIVHRDLKPQNILVTRDNRLKIADFGLARIYGFNMALTQVVVTLWYRSPEVLLQKSYATPVDMWSVGCIFAELHTRRPLFKGKSDIDQLRTIFDIIGLPSREDWPDDASVVRSSFADTRPKLFRDIIYQLSPEAEDLLKQLLTFNPDQRLSASNALLHGYFHDSESEDDDDDDDDEDSDEDESEEDDSDNQSGKTPELPRHESGSSMATSSSQQTQSSKGSQSQGSSLSF